MNTQVSRPMRQKILDVITRFGNAGATHEDVRLALPQYMPSSLPINYLALEEAGLVRFTERTRQSSFNRPQRIMVALRSAAA